MASQAKGKRKLDTAAQVPSFVAPEPGSKDPSYSLGDDKRCKVFATTEVRFKSTSKKASNVFSNFYPDVAHDNLGASAAFSSGGRHFYNSEHYYQWAKAHHIDQEYADSVVLPLGSSALAAGKSRSASIKSAGSRGAYVDWKYGRLCVAAGKPPTERRKDGTWKKVRGCKVDVEAIKAFAKDRMKTFDYDDTMRAGLRGKFSNGRLRDALLATGDARLAESGGRGNQYWMVTGANRLGQLLMELREELREQ